MQAGWEITAANHDHDATKQMVSGCGYWGQAILRKYIRPAAQRVGIQKRFGWHTFRHAYSTMLRNVGTEFKVMQELLRHSSFRSTLDVYTQAVTPAKHAAPIGEKSCPS
jgi:integrase